jgi:Zn-dependent peptidase ImmA (M78 family)
LRELLAHASTLGVSVHVAHLPAPYRGYYDSDRRMVVYGFDLTPIERRCVLAHELGHAFYDHRCRGHQASEDAADLYAAHLLIDPAEYAEVEAVYPSVETIAEELGVTVDLVRIFQERSLTRLRGITYARSRMGVGQFRHAWAHQN